MSDGLKYSTPYEEGDESKILPNLLGLTDAKDIEKEEAKGFAKAEVYTMSNLTDETRFDLNYINTIHKVALEHLYSFAGTYRTVNVSKGGFLFPAAQFIQQSMETLETEVLNNLPTKYEDQDALIKNIAIVHAEILFIHPYREGNGRTARLLANLMSYQAGYEELKYERIDSKDTFDAYVQAVQKAADKDYSYMEDVIRQLF